MLRSDSLAETKPAIYCTPPTVGWETAPVGTLAACQPSYLVVLRPAVLDQVSHVVDLAGVTPAPRRGLSEW